MRSPSQLEHLAGRNRKTWGKVRAKLELCAKKLNDEAQRRTVAESETCAVSAVCRSTDEDSKNEGIVTVWRTSEI